MFRCWIATGSLALLATTSGFRVPATPLAESMPFTYAYFTTTVRVNGGPPVKYYTEIVSYCRADVSDKRMEEIARRELEKSVTGSNVDFDETWSFPYGDRNEAVMGRNRALMQDSRQSVQTRSYGTGYAAYSGKCS